MYFGSFTSKLLVILQPLKVAGKTGELVWERCDGSAAFLHPEFHNLDILKKRKIIKKD
jgi:hypothetical protein